MALPWAKLDMLTIPQTKPICSPWLMEGSINMLFAWRGTGKTWVSDALAMSVVAGVPFLDWLTYPGGVLYVDAEMRLVDQRERFRALQVGMGKITKDFPGLIILSHAEEEFRDKGGLPDLSVGRRGWELVRRNAEGCKLVILDNLTSLCRTGDENDAVSWAHVNQQLLRLRNDGIATLLIHHAGKPKQGVRGDQRGTSRKEDIMDCVIALDQVRSGDNETVVKWEFTKARHFNAGRPFEFRILTSSDAKSTRLERMPDADEELQVLKAAGLSVRKIAAKVGKSKSTISEHLRKLKGNEIPDRQL